MRPRFLIPPSPEAWAGLQVHELARDYPELLPLLRGGEGLPGALGAATLRDAGLADPGTLCALQGAVAWRHRE